MAFTSNDTLEKEVDEQGGFDNASFEEPKDNLDVTSGQQPTNSKSHHYEFEDSIPE